MMPKDMEEARKEVEAFASTHDDFEEARPLMYKASLSNAKADLDELYKIAKEYKMATSGQEWYTSTTNATRYYPTATELQMYQDLHWDKQRIYNMGDAPIMQEIYEQMIGQQQSNQGIPTQPSSNPEKTLKLIKKSIREIKAEAVSPETQEIVNSKITRLEQLGIIKQAAVLKAELALRVRLARVQEWDYKVLPYDELKKFEAENKMTATRDGLKIHIDKLEEYVGNTTVDTEKKDMIIPNSVLSSLELAKERQVFNEFGVLWVEKVKDPLLLGCIEGCKDYFLIDEWGEDIKFNDIVKEKKDAKK